MSSPIAKSKKSPIDKLLIKTHQKFSHNHRVEILSQHFSDIIKKFFKTSEQIKLLDVGCGDMSITEKICLSDNRIIPVCIDVFTLPEKFKGEKRWSKYLKFNGRNIPFPDKHFEIAILSDVLHHDFRNAYNLLRESVRVSKYVLVKDHFEYGVYSRLILKLMDIIGNWGYGVTIPKKYFTKMTYQSLLEQLNVKEEHRIENVNLYFHNLLFKFLLRPSWQFISLIKSETTI